LVDQFLDEMLRMREPAAFILHGHGTGAMKSAVREHLAASRVVRHFEAASHENGGDAFTVALLR
jgi:DNA mismatch repair protein MutS2